MSAASFGVLSVTTVTGVVHMAAALTERTGFTVVVW
jgi:hypothetical protein